MEHHIPDPEHEQPWPREIPVHGTALEKVSAYLSQVISEADARGQAIERDDAQAIATLLAALLDSDVEMNSFAETGHGDPERLRVECQQLKQRPSRSPDIPLWIARFEAYLDAQEHPPAEADTR